MKDINNLFFELIQVAIGTRICLSHTPSADEWGELYAMAKKQSLVGICFAGVQRLVEQRQEPPEMLYLTWMGMAAKIQQRNEVVNRQCVELQKRLSADGQRSSILKGQGVGALYCVNGGQKRGETSTEGSDPAIEKNVEIPDNTTSLQLLRQSGDIDVFVAGGMEKVLGYCTEKFGDVEYDYVNAHLPVYEDTEVELHWTMQAMTNLLLNVKLQKWVKENSEKIMGGTCSIGNSTIVTPSLQVNRFYILLHAYNHLTGEGLGFRQLMDFFFVLQNEVVADDERKELNQLFGSFGMKRFAGAVMWIMQVVFGLEEKYMVCAPNESEGRFVLNEVLLCGNFGHHDERKKKIGKGKWVSVMSGLQHSIRLFGHYPSNTIWLPIWLVYHFLWKRLKRI